MTGTAAPGGLEDALRKAARSYAILVIRAGQYAGSDIDCDAARKRLEKAAVEYAVAEAMQDR